MHLAFLLSVTLELSLKSLKAKGSNSPEPALHQVRGRRSNQQKESSCAIGLRISGKLWHFQNAMSSCAS